MSRIQQTFAALDGAKALIPYITVGDPNLDTTLALMHSLVENGADILELGVPFSDPMADGPTIQRAAERALANKVSLNDVLNIVRRFRETNGHTPVVLMGYLNPIHKMGYQAFAQAAAEAGVDGVLTVDSPVETITPLHRLHLSDCPDHDRRAYPNHRPRCRRLCLLRFAQRRYRCGKFGYRRSFA